jgi:hypothetical protein
MAKPNGETMLKIGAIALAIYSTIALCALWWFEFPTIGCGAIPRISADGVAGSGAYYCHVIVKPR